MTSGMESLGQVRTQAVVLLLLAFLAGALVGGATERVLLHRAVRTARADRADGPGGKAGFYGWLGVSDTQRTQIDAIFAKRRPHLDSLDAMRRSAMDSARKEMDAVLTAEQRAKLDSSRARGRGGRGGYGPPGHFDRGMRGPRDSARGAPAVP